MRTFSSLLAGLGLATLALTAGCTPAALPDAGLAAAAGAQGLSPLTSTEVAAGYAEFADELAVSAGDRGAAGDDAGPQRGLSDEVREQIVELQMQLDSGELTAEQFAEQVDALLGDRAPQRAFAGRHFFGAPFGGRIRDRIAAALELTEEQKDAAREIFETLHADIRLATLAALANMRLELTDAQRKELDELRAAGFESIRPRQPVRPATIGRGGIRRHFAAFFDRLADALELTEEQRAAIREISAGLRSDVRELHRQAREDFRALLTAEQIAILDRIERALRPHRPQPDHERDDDDDQSDDDDSGDDRD